MHRVLKDTGSIYLHCDFRLSHYIKVLMDKIFGLSNFRNDIVWRYAVNYKAETYPRDNDNILYYTKSEDCTYKQQYRKSKKMKKRLKNVVHQENGKLYYYQGRNLKGSPYIRKLRNKDFVTSNNLEEYFTKREYIGVRVSNVWDDIGFVARGSESVGYDTQKPTRLLERIIKSSSNKGDVVADFFMGSETTIEVAKELGRNYIGCDINPRSVELTQKRLEKLKANSNT